MNQHTQPCRACPFRRDITPGELGGSPVEVYVGQSVAPFWLPCHCSPNYQGKESNAAEVQQCAGAAIFRSNIGVSRWMPNALLKLPPDRGLVFQDLIEFCVHHEQTSKAEALMKVTPEFIKECFHKEWNNQQVRVQLVERKI